MTGEIFQDFIRKVFIPEIRRRRKAEDLQNSEGLLLVDGHSSRANPETMMLLQAENIGVLTFVSHAYHLMQPLDRGVFREFKTVLTQTKGSSSYKKQTEWRREMLVHCIGAMRQATSPHIIKDSFRISGLLPVDRKQVLNETNFPNMNLPQVVEEVTGRRPRAGFKISHRVLTSEESIAELQAVALSKRHRAE